MNKCISKVSSDHNKTLGDQKGGASLFESNITNVEAFKPIICFKILTVLNTAM